MTTQDTITIPRDLGPWIIALIRTAPAAASHSRYTPAAAIGEVEQAIKAEDEPAAVQAVASLSAPVDRVCAQNEELTRRCTELTGDRDAALDMASALRQELRTIEARLGEALGDIKNNKELAEVKIAAQATRIQALRSERTELTTESRATKELLRVVNAEIESMTAEWLERDADKLEAELAITPEGADAIAADLAARSAERAIRAPHRAPHRFDLNIDRDPIKLELTILFAAAPLTPATTPEQNESF